LRASALMLVYRYEWGLHGAEGLVCRAVSNCLVTSAPVVYSVSGEFPSAILLASASAMSVPAKQLCTLILNKYSRMPAAKWVLRVVTIEPSVCR
jgi:hypothetical protein